MSPENSTNVGSGSGGLGGTTGVDPKAGGRRGPGEERAFEPGPDSVGGQLAGDAKGPRRPADAEENSDLSNGSGAD